VTGEVACLTWELKAPAIFSMLIMEPPVYWVVRDS
jgi:hypothetical protein